MKRRIFKGVLETCINGFSEHHLTFSVWQVPPLTFLPKGNGCHLTLVLEAAGVCGIFSYRSKYGLF